MDVVEIQGSVRCGGIDVRPGDLIFADVVGTVVVPQDLADEVIVKAWEKVNGESRVRDALRAGASVAETFAKYGRSRAGFRAYPAEDPERRRAVSHDEVALRLRRSDGHAYAEHVENGFVDAIDPEVLFDQ